MRVFRGAAIALGGLALVALSAGCSKTPVTAPKAPLEVVAGVVTSIEDMRPLDGGVELTIARDAGGEELFFLGSLRWIEPNPKPDYELHAKVSQLVVGDQVIAAGNRQAGGIELIRLERVPPR